MRSKEEKIWIFNLLHGPLVMLDNYITSDIYMHVCSAAVKPRLSSWILFYCFHSLWEKSKRLILCPVSEKL